MPGPDAIRAPRGATLRAALVALSLLAWTAGASALESDRQQPLLINADATDGTLGDGTAVLRGSVEIRQGTLLVRADVAEVIKADGRVRSVHLTGDPVLLQQEIENEGLVSATARDVRYQVATGIVTLTGNADVNHPQYQISGQELVYDMNKQHFAGSGGEGNGRVRIELAPEVVPAVDGESGSDAGGDGGADGETGDAESTPESQQPPAEADGAAH